jgi:hypothetical protein
MRRLSTHAVGDNRVELTVTPLDPRSFTPLKSDLDGTGAASRRRRPKKMVVVAAALLAVPVGVALATVRVARPVDRHAATPASPKAFDVAARHPEVPTLPGQPPHLRELQHLRDVSREKRVVSGINVPLRATAIEQGWFVSCWIEEPARSRSPRGGLGPNQSRTSVSRTLPKAGPCRGRRPG